jgi:tRNA(fMet)-specific endonuclease VapC
VKYVLDTNTVSALMRRDAATLARLRSTGNRDVSIPQPVLAEIAYGIERLPKSKRRDALEAKFELIRVEMGRCLWTDAVSEQFGRVKAALEKAGERIEDFDVAIAAHALAESAVLVTSNVDHMERVPGLAVEDWGRDEPAA